MLKELRPKLFVEVGDTLLRNQGDSAGALLGQLQRLGYEMVGAATGAPVISGAGVRPHFDVLCVHDSC